MKHNMKIYEIATGYTPVPAGIGAATEIVVEELTRALRKRGCDARIIDIRASDRAPTDLPVEEVTVPKLFSGTDIRLGMMHKLKRVAYSVALAGVLKKILRQTEETVVLHFHNQYNLFFFLKLVPAVLRDRCLIAYTNHSGIWRLPWDEIRDTVRRRYFQEAECMRRADVVFLLNEQTGKNVTEHLGIPEEKLVYIANGVNTDTYRMLPEKEKQSARKKWGLSGKRVILQVGSVNENKGQLRSARCLAPVLKAHPELVYAYAGGIVSEEYQQRILKFAADNDLEQQIRYLGMVAPGPELNGLYNTAAATIVHSRYEGFSLAAIESCACGVPVLHREDAPVSLPGGGIQFEESTIFQTIEAVVLEQGAAYAQIRGAGLRCAAGPCSWDNIAAEYLSGLSNPSEALSGIRYQASQEGQPA